MHLQLQPFKITIHLLRYKSFIFTIYLQVQNVLRSSQNFQISFDNHCKYMIENIMTTLKAKMVVLNVSLNMI